MALKISKEDRTSIEECAAALTTAKGHVDSAVAAYNGARSDLHDKLVEIKDALQQEWEEKSERWQQGEKGEAAGAWIEEIEGKADEIESELDVDMPDPDELVNFSDAPE